ncbi:MAG: hypothetical protein AB7P00_42425 [Sandaracinaceae bacterium]
MSTPAPRDEDDVAVTFEGDAVRQGRAEAAAVIWSWRGASDDRAARARRARIGALIRSAIGGAIGAVLTFAVGRPILGAIAFGIAGLTLVLGLLSPLGAYAALERAILAVSKVIGAALTWLLLTPVYFFFFAPFGSLFRRGRRDPMRRHIDKASASYWQPRSDDRPLDRPY